MVLLDSSTLRFACSMYRKHRRAQPDTRGSTVHAIALVVHAAIFAYAMVSCLVVNDAMKVVAIMVRSGVHQMFGSRSKCSSSSFKFDWFDPFDHLVA